MERDTIVAIATAMGNSGIGIIRISGEEAFTIAEKIFHPKKREKVLSEEEAYTVHYGTVWDEEEMLDEVLVMLMKAPHSYTMENTVEIDCHGGNLVMRKVLEAVVKQGARIADPGEFTKRAFINGRIDLSQAEAVMDLIEAKSEMALKSSVTQLRGSVKEKIQELRQSILYEIAFIESALDDPEHISLDGYPQQLEETVEKLLKEVENLLISGENGRILKEGVKTVIVGRPNVGKSSLLNILVGEERAIVTEIAGTTRDVLEEHIQLNGISLNLLDTAGIRSTEDIVEKIGVTRALEHMQDADLVLYVIDASVPLTEEDHQIIEQLSGKKSIVLLNKTDLGTIILNEQIEEVLSCPIIPISAKENQGIDKLEKTVAELFFQGNVSFNDELYITNIRQRADLKETRDSLKMVLDSIRNQMPEDFFSIDLMNAYTSLGRILGEEVGEDLVNEIFEKFCMGK